MSAEREQYLIELFKEHGPQNFPDLVVLVSGDEEVVNASLLSKTLEDGPFVVDDSGRYHLTDELK